jgi:EpsI family protein
MLLIAQSAGQTGLLQVHRPEFCYPAGGYELSPIVQLPVKANGRDVMVNQLTASMPGRTEQILYWTRVGNAMPASWAEQRLAIAADNMKGYIPDGVLVRVSTVDPDARAAVSRLSNFVERLIGGMPSNSRRVLISST